MDIKLDPTTHDRAIVNNSMVLITGADEVEQRLRCRLKLIRGEWFLDVTRGVPYFQVVFVKGIALDRIGAAIKREILTVPGVLELQAYTQDLNTATRRLTISFKVLVTDGVILTITEEIGP